VSKNYVKGWGLSYILAKHGPEAVEGILEAIAKGVKKPSSPSHLILEHNGTRAVLFRMKGKKDRIPHGY
jgi:hypothetical protein